MNSLSSIIKKYAAFEAEVRAVITKICQDYCSACDGVCCRPEICAETLTSPFLQRLQQRFASDAVFIDGRGWLTASGCALTVGRPPVCYQFFCGTVINKRSTAEFRYAVIVLSNLIEHVGKNAIGRRHIVALETDSELGRVKLARFEKQFNEAAAAFDAICAFFDDDETHLKLSLILDKISPPPADFHTGRLG